MPKKPLAYRGSKPFVFVSYAHADKQLVEPIIAGLHARGLRIWFDDGLDVGDIWEEVLAERVKQCVAMLCLVSTRFTDSNNCLDEIHNAKEQKKELLIIHLEDEELPEIFQFRYSRFHALRLSAYHNQGELLDKFVATKKLRSCIEQTQEVNAVSEERPEDLFQKGKACYGAESYEETVSWYRKAAEMGHPGAMRSLGVCYANGHGVPLSHEEAVRWYLRAADLGDAHAMCWLGLCYANGWGVSLSHEEAVRWYRRAADNEDAEAMRYLGYCYEYEQGVRESLEESASWYHRAADKGDAEGMLRLAFCYADGFGVTKSHVEAANWFRRAADKGNARAMYWLGSCYESGEGVNKSLEEAVNWYRRAADMGDDEAMLYLGNCYKNGWGVPKNQEQADYWYNRAEQAASK